jgi:hypothetical protein
LQFANQLKANLFSGQLCINENTRLQVFGSQTRCGMLVQTPPKFRDPIRLDCDPGGMGVAAEFVKQIGTRC